MIKVIMLWMYFFVSTTYCMKALNTTYSSFSRQSPSIPRDCFFPILHECVNLKQARNAFFSLALVSQQSYRQMMDVSFLKAILKELTHQYLTSDLCIIRALAIPVIEKYGKSHEELFNVILNNTVSSPALAFFQECLKTHPINVDFSIAKEKITLLMAAVYRNNVAWTNILIEHGADCNAYTFHRKQGQAVRGYWVRDCNILYRNDFLTRYLDPLGNHLFPNIHRKTDIFFEKNISELTDSERLNRAREMYFTQYFYIEKSYKNFCRAGRKASDLHEICSAFYIDKLLEKKGAISSFRKENHPLRNVLVHGDGKKRPGFVYTMILSCIFDNNIQKIKERVPRLIADILCTFISPKKRARTT